MLARVLQRKGRRNGPHRGECAQGNQRTGGGLDEDLLEGVGILLEGRVHFQDDPVLVELGEDNRNLTLAKSVVEGVVNGLGLDVEAVGLVTVHIHAQLESAALLVGAEA